MLAFLKQPYPWYVAGALIGLTVPLLLLLGNKRFGISSTLRHICAISGAKADFFRYNWRQESWNLLFVAGIMIGGWLAHTFFANPEPVQLAAQTKQDLQALGITDFSALVPVQIFNWGNVLSVQGLVFMVLGGFLIGFGTRWADGCTSGHAITGLSNLQLASLVAVIGFFVGGLIITHFVLPYLF